jgi:hypothetical protein
MTIRAPTILKKKGYPFLLQILFPKQKWYTFKLKSWYTFQVK